MEGKTLEELREAMVSTVASYHIEMGSVFEGDQWGKEEVAEFENAVLEDERKRLWKAVDKPDGVWCRRRGVNWQCPFYNYESFFIRCELFGEDLIHDDKCEKCKGMNYDEVIVPSPAEQLSEIALKAFDAGPHKTEEGHTAISWPPDEKPKIGKETCKTYSESWCKGQDCRVCQFNIPGMGPAEVKP